MPLFMDLHIIPGAKAEDVAEAHVKDLYCQDEYGCKAITYWFDEHRGKAFCLIEAPNKEAVTELHQKAHGLVPNQVIPVDPSLVESFLGRLTDPEEVVPRPGSGLKVFEDSAFRYFLYISLPDFVLMRNNHPGTSVDALEEFAFTSLDQIIKPYGGRRVMLRPEEFYYSFSDLREALLSATSIREKLLERSSLLDTSITLSCGEPISGDMGFFEEVSAISKALNYQCKPGMITLASGVERSALAGHRSLLNDHKGHILLMDSEKEAFLARLVSVIERYFMNPELDVGLLASRLAYSNSKLYRLCRLYTGLSPNRFIREYRLFKAKKLLRESSDSISEIGFHCGFNTPSYFTRCFQQSFGINPMDYRMATAPVNEM